MHHRLPPRSSILGGTFASARGGEVSGHIVPIAVLYVWRNVSANLSIRRGREAAATWRGKLLGKLTLVVRFEQDTDGHLVGFLDSPDRHAKGIPITSATFSDGKLDARVTGVGGRLQADVKGSTMSGQWTQAGMTHPLTLTKD